MARTTYHQADDLADTRRTSCGHVDVSRQGSRLLAGQLPFVDPSRWERLAALSQSFPARSTCAIVYANVYGHITAAEWIS